MSSQVLTPRLKTFPAMPNINPAPSYSYSDLGKLIYEIIEKGNDVEIRKSKNGIKVFAVEKKLIKEV